MDVRIERWSDDDLDLLRRCNAPELMAHIGGPESEQKLILRHARYLAGWKSGTARMFRITIDDVPQGVGSVGYWPKEWQGSDVYETGWTVVEPYQGRGIASAAVRAVLAHAAREGERRYVHAFPSTGNAASNSLCRRVGFVYAGECDFEYPKGNAMRCND